MRFVNIAGGDFPYMAIATPSNVTINDWSNLESRSRQVMYVFNPNKPWLSTEINHTGSEVGSILSYARYTEEPDTWEKIFNIPEYTYPSPQHALNAVIDQPTWMYAPRWGTHYTTQRETFMGIGIAIKGNTVADGKIQYKDTVTVVTFRALRNSSEAGGTWYQNPWNDRTVRATSYDASLNMDKLTPSARFGGDVMLSLPAGDPYNMTGGTMRMTDAEILDIMTRQTPHESNVRMKLATSETIERPANRNRRFWTRDGADKFREISVTVRAINAGLNEYNPIKDALAAYTTKM